MSDTLECSCDDDESSHPINCEMCDVLICLTCTQGIALCEHCADIQLLTLEEEEISEHEDLSDANNVLKCSCNGDLPLHPLDCESCDVPICLKCSAQGVALCKLCIDIQSKTLEEKTLDHKCMKCDDIPHISNKCAECDEQVKLCKRHMNTCQFDFNIQRERKCNPRIRCSNHSMKCECYRSCIHCGMIEVNENCHICKYNVCKYCSTLYKGYRVCYSHERLCTVDRCKMYPLPEFKCPVSDEDGQKCMYYVCPSKHYDEIHHPIFALKDGTYTKLRYDQCKDRTLYCKSHIFRCGVLRGLIPDCFASTFGCQKTFPLPFSITMNFRKYHAHCFDFCFDCMNKVRTIIDSFLLILKRNKIYMDKNVTELIIVHILDISVKPFGTWSSW